MRHICQKKPVLGNFVGYNFKGLGKLKASTKLSFESLLVREKMPKASSWLWLWNMLSLSCFFASTHRAFNFHD